MNWYHLFNPDLEKWLALAVLTISFGLILSRRFNIAYISLAAAILLLALGVTNPAEALLLSVNWDVLFIYWGYGLLSIALRESRVPAWVANRLLARITREKQALLFLCLLAMFLSSFMANPVVVIMLAPLAIELASKLKASLFQYLIALAVSSNVVTTVTMIADPPALILATSTGMSFLDFYWFQGHIGLGTLSILGLAVAAGVLYLQLRQMNASVHMSSEKIEVSLSPLLLFAGSVLALAAIPWQSLGSWNHPGLVGLGTGILSLAMYGHYRRSMLREFDWNTSLFLVGIFIVVATVNNVGLLNDFAVWLANAGFRNPAVYLAIFVWVSVVLSSFIDNVPYTVLMLPVCTGVAQTLGINPFPFYFGMLAGTGIGGNLTPVGATANVLACGMLEKRGYRIRLGEYLGIALPFSISAVIVIHILIQFIWL